LADPVSWFVVERGWKVVDREGDEIGKVDEITGDENADIFDGLSVSSGIFSQPRYVPAEQVHGITEGCITLSLSRDEVERLAEAEDTPASLQVSSEGAALADRAAAPFVDEGVSPRPGAWQRLRDRLFGR
jgi:hypothetical protein